MKKIKEIWNKIALKLRIGIMVFISGFLLMTLGIHMQIPEMMGSVPAFTDAMGFIFAFMGGLMTIIGFGSMCAFWLAWATDDDL